jgi:hypothetical protein
MIVVKLPSMMAPCSAHVLVRVYKKCDLPPCHLGYMLKMQ